MPGGEGVAVAHSLSDIFHLQGWQLAAQASCAGSLQCVFASLWTTSGLRSLQTALDWSVISTEAVHPSLSAPPWFVLWHSTRPMKLGCLFNETNYKRNYQASYVKGIDTKAERKKIKSEVKFSLTMGYVPCCTAGLGHKLPPVSPLFSRRLLCFRISCFSAQESYTCLENLLDLQHSMHSALPKCLLYVYLVVSALQHILRFLLLKRYHRNRKSLLTCL